MQKRAIFLTATAALVLASSMWVVHAASFSVGIPSQKFWPIEKIGCEGRGEKCPYGFTAQRRDGHLTCVPCWPQEHGYSHRRYRDYGDENYEPRRYRQYRDGDYEEPRRYRDY